MPMGEGPWLELLNLDMELALEQVLLVWVSGLGKHLALQNLLLALNNLQT
jgi:hypothetical protein